MSKKKDLTLKDYLRISLWSLKINWDISPFITVVYFVTSIFNNLQGILYSYVIAVIIDTLIKLSSESITEIESLIPLIAYLGGIELLSIISNGLTRYCNRFKRRLTRSYLSRFEYEKINKLGVQTIQLPDVANKMQITHDWLWNIPDVTEVIVDLIATFIRGIVAGIIIFNFSPWISLGILIVSILSYFQKKVYLKKDFEWQTSEENMESAKKAWWVQHSLSSSEQIDEISLVGGFRYLDKKFRNFFDYFNKGFDKILRQEGISGFGVDILSIFVVLGGSVQIFLLVLRKSISIGETTFFLGAVKSFYGGVSNFFSNLIYLRDIVLKEKEVYEFFNLESSIKDGNIKLERLIKPPSIEIKNISFRYPNSNRDIFKNFSMSIKNGEKLAIVGENGAGKSTLVKLLCRIYDPQRGEILVNGVNIKDLKINDWYKNIGVLFQDFNFYGSLTVEENIYIGKSIKEIDRGMIKRSARNADAHDFIMKYKSGYQTVMNERFKGGIRPSNGQQQKIAIARFFYRDAPLAIFDEPTSAIDAGAEYKIFNRIYKFFNNKTVIIISHRFSTVRKADRIIVLKDGRIIEQGTHQELINRKGVYADNFRKQAEGYN